MTISKKQFLRMSRIFPALFVGSMFLVSIQAQQTSEFLSLEDAIQAATKNNSAIQSARIDEAIAQENFKQTNAGFLPQLNFSYTGLVTDNPLNAFGFKLQQKTVTAADFNPDVLNHPKGSTDFSAKVELLQPLFNLDAVYMKQGAQKQVEGIHYKALRTREYLTFETKKAYYQLQMAHKAVKVLEEALVTSKSIYDFTNNRLQQGLVQKSDLLNVEVQVLGIESRLDEAKSNVFNASDYLSVLMNKPSGTLYHTDEMKKTDAPVDVAGKLPEDRSDFVAMRKAIEATGLMMKSSRMKFVPRLNAFGAYQWNDKKIAGFDAGSYLAGLQLSWNIFDGALTKRKTNTLKKEQDKLGVQLHSMQQENQLMLDKAYRDLHNAVYKINQQNTAIAHAIEALRILQNRYEEGLVNTTDVLTAQNQVAQQQLLLVQAKLQYNTNVAYIQFLTSTNNNNQQ